MKKELPSFVKTVVSGLHREGFEAFVVGGAVRDLLLKRSPKDWDIATNARPSRVEKIFPKTVPTGKDFGTITVLTPKEPVQVTTYRREAQYKDRRRPSKVKFSKNLEEDLSRRDFTVNAMALDIKGFKIVDPFHGRKDLRQKKLRTVGNAEKRFSEDALRMVRAGRFVAQLGFVPTLDLNRAAKKRARLVRSLSEERIRDELSHLLLTKKPSLGFYWMDKADLLKHLLPDLLKGKGCKQGGWHRYDVFRHTLETIDAAPADLSIRLALLFHDIAKPQTRTREGQRYHFYRHEHIGTGIAERVLKKYRFAGDLRKKVGALVRHHLFEAEPIAKTDTAVRRLMRRVGEDYVDDLLILRRADIKGCGPHRRVTPALAKIARRITKIRKEEQALKVTDLAANGQDIMRWLKLEPGPVVGKILKELLETVLQNPELNTKRSLRKLTQAIV